MNFSSGGSNEPGCSNEPPRLMDLIGKDLLDLGRNLGQVYSSFHNKDMVHNERHGSMDPWICCGAAARAAAGAAAGAAASAATVCTYHVDIGGREVPPR